MLEDRITRSVMPLTGSIFIAGGSCTRLRDGLRYHTEIISMRKSAAKAKGIVTAYVFHTCLCRIGVHRTGTSMPGVHW